MPRVVWAVWGSSPDNQGGCIVSWSSRLPALIITISRMVTPEGDTGPWRVGYLRRSPAEAAGLHVPTNLIREPLEAEEEKEAKEEALRWVRAEEARLLADLDNLDELRGTVAGLPEESRSTAWDRISADDDR